MVSAYDAFIRKSLVPESECKKMDKDQAIQKLKTEVKMLSKEELITLYEMSVIENTSLAEENEKLESELAQSKQDYSARMRHNPEKGPNKNWVYEAMKKLDGVAAVNLEEPSPGDLKRVYSAYVALQEDYDALKAENEKTKSQLLNYQLGFATQSEKVKILESDIELKERDISEFQAEVERLKSALKDSNDVIFSCIKDSESRGYQRGGIIQIQHNNKLLGVNSSEGVNDGTN